MTKESKLTYASIALSVIIIALMVVKWVHG